MTNCNVFFSEVAEDGSRVKLMNAWIYWRPPGGTHQILRSDEKGLVYAFASGDRTRQDAYTVEFVTSVGTDVEVFHSQGNKPLPDSVVTALTMPLYTVPLSLSAGLAALGPVYAAPGGAVTSVRRLPLGEIRLPIVRIRLTQPADEPSLLFALWENLNEPEDDYYTTGILQGSAWHGQASPPYGHAAAAAPATVHPRIRGIPIRGRVPAAATAVKVRVFDAAGNAVSLLQNGSDAAGSLGTELAAALGAPSGHVRDFSVDVFFPPATPLGPVQIVVQPDGVTPAMVGSYAFHLVGAQIALVDDFDGNPNGQVAGPGRTATDEVHVVDYRDSPAHGPQANETALRTTQRDRTRARRLIAYTIRSHHLKTIPLVAVATPAMPAGTAQLPVTQMPFFMAELQLLGITRTQLEDLMVRRLNRNASGPNQLTLGANWDLSVTWHGPDRANTNPYLQPPLSLTLAQTATLALDTNTNKYARRLSNVTSGVLTGALQPPPPAIPFPIAGRRQPAVMVSDAGATQRRAWGRHGGAQHEALIIQWQPVITTDGAVAGTPIIRGGNGRLTLTSVSCDGVTIEQGLVFPRPTPTPAPAAAPPAAGAPVIAMPSFRLLGQNPTRAQVEAMVTVLVEDVYRRNVATSNWLEFISLANWQETGRRVVGHESGHRQYETRSRVERFQRPPNVFWHGHELGMPLFGFPHGYGMGQLDPPGNADRVWDVEANARRSVEMLLLTMAPAAMNHLRLAGSRGFLPQQRMRAIFQRDTVRRYNSGPGRREFIWDARTNDWLIQPTPRVNPTIFYPDEVLGTRIPYERLISAPNRREPAPANHPPLDTELMFPATAYFPGI